MASTFARFPFPFRIGTDICQIPRVGQILQGPKARPARFIRRVLTEEELTVEHEILAPFMTGQHDDRTGTGVDDGKFIAARRFMASRSVYSSFLVRSSLAGTCLLTRLIYRWAAKEAVIKASDDKLTFHDIVIRKKASGQPYAIIKAGDGRRQDREALLSISHESDYATAVCLAATGEAWPAEAEDRAATDEDVVAEDGMSSSLV